MSRLTHFAVLHRDSSSQAPGVVVYASRGQEASSWPLNRSPHPRDNSLVAIMSQKSAVSPRARGAAPLRVLPCAAANLRRAARAVTHLYDERLRVVGLTIAQFTLLQTLTLTGRTSQRRLGQILVLDSTTLTRTLRPLERRGWIRRRPGKDRRERQIELTEAGRRLFRAAVPHWNRAQKRVSAQIGRRWNALMRELSAIAALPGQS